MRPSSVNLALNLTSACNLDCSYCYMDELNSGKSMSTAVLDAVMKIIDTEEPRFNVCFFGGEPTLAKRKISYFLENVNLDKVSRFTMSTNGTKPDALNEIAQSIYTLTDHRLKLGIQMSNKDSPETLSAIDLSLIDVEYRYIIDADKVSEVTPELVGVLLERPYEGINFRFDVYGNYDNVSEEELLRVISLLRTYQQTNQRMSFNVHAADPDTVGDMRKLKQCPVYRIAIDTNGDVLKCHRHFNSSRGHGQDMGNIVKDQSTAMQAWHYMQEATHTSYACVGQLPNKERVAGDVYTLTL